MCLVCACLSHLIKSNAICLYSRFVLCYCVQLHFITLMHITSLNANPNATLRRRSNRRVDGRVQGRQSWGIGRVATPQILGRGVFGGRRGVAGGSWGSWLGRKILLYHVQEVCSKVVTFEEK